MTNFSFAKRLLIASLLLTGITTFSSCKKSNSDVQSSTDVARTAISAVPIDPTLPHVITLAGLAGQGYVDGTPTSAKFNAPSGVVRDNLGNLFVADMANHSIRKITPEGVVSTFAGNGTPGSADGNGTTARFFNPTSIAIGFDGFLYVADRSNHTVRRISPAGNVTTFAGTPGVPGSVDGPAGSARFNLPTGIASDVAGNVFVADAGNHKIRNITAGGLVSTIAGTGIAGSADGPASFAQFNAPTDVAVDIFSGRIYIADGGNNKIRSINGTSITTLAGGGTGNATGFSDGIGTAARFRRPSAIAVDAGGTLYVVDKFNNAIRKVTSSGVTTTLAGNGLPGFADGLLSVARFNLPAGIEVDVLGHVYITDQGTHLIRKIVTPDRTGEFPEPPIF